MGGGWRYRERDERRDAMDEMMDTRHINEKRDGGTRSGDETSERATMIYETREMVILI